MDKLHINRLIGLNDVFQTLVIVSGALIARTIPPFRWRSITRQLAAVALKLRHERTRQGVAKLDYFLPDGPSTNDTNYQLLLRITASHIEETILFAKLRQDAAFRPPIETTGVDLVASAIQQSSGVLLWTASQIFTPILVRMLARDEGWPINHLRVWSHGPSLTRYARRFLNPTQLRAENKYANHIVIPRSGPTQALLEVARRLRDGQVVQFHGVSNSKTPVSVPLFHGEMLLATGAPRVALKNGAALFGVAATRSPDAGKFFIKFAPLLPPEASKNRRHGNRQEIVRETAEGFRLLLEQSLSISPDIWPIQRDQYPSPATV